MTKLNLTVEAAAEVAQGVRQLVLRAADGAPLPPFTAGAHLRIDLPDGRSNAYSLVDADGRAGAPDSYTLAVLYEAEGKGGSRHMHALQPGHRVTAEGPKNDFPLAEHPGRAILIAGGIGITPILSMAVTLAESGRPYRLHYAARTHAAAAYAEALTARHGAALDLHLDDQAGRFLDVAAVLADSGAADHVYVCGPKPMIQAVRAAAEARGFTSDRIHSELFENPTEQAGDQPFEVELASTGEVLTVPPGRTIIEVLEEAGHDVMFDCQRGDCGICQTTVLEGVPDHRDVVLSEAERAAGDVMQICVSRALTPRLKLDL
ncbi:2Fe-2S iron-sulfur cluster binding domain-containing protein [Paracoccus sp. S-4012]|uniref:PDR/VanB family oxidoreductase n=1 Tax=Paracoccus sp. S-4012 TaxID=2665648 RepID=UPI0012B00C47|nr:PDR/VanB family oxidoreductase [Paracoccus sp. S-4012]MRX48992.1 2Fe-2S iron-sulfur cluster binding domain-containing protein [Paracoccus sp. S-4012]